MPVKIGKVAKELNVGTQSIIDFLSKNGVTVDSNPNTRISDEQYEKLVKAFKSDRDTKIKSEGYLKERQKEKKVAKEEAKVEEIKTTTEPVQAPKVLGKIDLTQAGKPQPKKEAPKQKVEEKPAVEKTKEAPKAEAPKPAVAEKHKATEEKAPVAKPQPNPVKEEPKPVVAVPAEKKAEPAPAIESEDKVFTLSTPALPNTPKVIGKIDLSAINQQTRPKKKTREEKRNERIAKEKSLQAARTAASGETGDRKKRKRIGKEKIDIEKSAKQISNEPTSRKEQKQNNAAAAGNAPAGKRNKDKAKAKRPFKPEVSEEDVQKQVKETLARLTSKPNKKSAKWRKEKRDAVSEREREAAELEAAEGKVLKLTEFVTANDLAVMMDVPINKVIGTCMSIGVMVSINQRLDAETINIVAEEFGYQTEFVSSEVVNAITTEEDKEEDLESRPPVVTVMGHVDHGKTSLLDYIRKANVIAGEAGGITQHIGAYNVKLANGRRITFLDTPGHEAFTAMRARGAKVTDIVIVIVAADDNIMPQTVEAINHASAAGVPIVFAINKIDKPTANPEKIKEGLANMNYLVEDWGGKYQSQDISAKKGIGVDELMEKVLLEADMLELKANPNRKATGSIIESSLDKGRGYVATVLVQNGTLKMGDILLAGTHYGKIKAMFNERNQRIQEAGPAAPVLILGLNGAPTAGDTFNVMDTDQEAREIANKREQLQRELGLRTQKRVTLEDIGRRKALGSFNELNIIVKGDVDGSIEALTDALIKLSTPEVQVNVIHKAVGAITESDVVLASASDAYIIGFQVRPSQAARRLAENEGVDIRLYSIIYSAIEEVKSAMEGMLEPETKEEILGSAEVLQTYRISKVGTIAGAIVREGKVKRHCKVRVIRDGIVRYTGDLGSLKRFKDDVKEVTTGFDCGLSVAGYNDIQEGDMIESFEEVQVQKSL
ncbi:MAG: translation initiation factor IF-2 [Muribaculaceae bacterium]|nr:translation initiation factor IF-2 [Muribaculaceae bacterium]